MSTEELTACRMKQKEEVDAIRNSQEHETRLRSLFHIGIMAKNDNRSPSVASQELRSTAESLMLFLSRTGIIRCFFVKRQTL